MKIWLIGLTAALSLMASMPHAQPQAAPTTQAR